jgi:hypothetical protein
MNYSSFPYLAHAHPEQFQLQLTFLNDLNALSSESSQPPILRLSPGSLLDETMHHSVILPSFFVLVMAIQFQIWLTSGHGEYQVLSEWHSRAKSRVQLKAGVSYIDYVSREELAAMTAWIQHVETFARSLIVP